MRSNNTSKQLPFSYPDGWKKIIIRDVCSVRRGASPRPIAEYLDTQGIPWVKISDATKSKTRFIEKTKQFIKEDGKQHTVIVEPGDLILSNSATPGIPKFMKITAGIHDGWLLLRNFDGIDKLFLYYFLIYTRPNLLRIADGTIFKNLKTDIVLDHDILLPPLTEQHRIGNVLSALDSKIENLQNQIDIFQSITKAVFKSWFIDFDGVSDFDNSKLGRIPKEWKVLLFRDFASCVKGFSYKGIEKFIEPRGFEFVTLNSIKEGGGFKKKFTWLESDRLKERHFVKELDLIIANTEQTKDARLLATPALTQFSYDYEKQLAVYSHHISKIEPKITNSKFYLYSFFLYYQQNIANAYHTGTGVWGFDHTSFENNYLILRPTDELLTKFENFSFTLHAQIIQNEKSISILAKIIETILPKLMLGEIRV